MHFLFFFIRFVSSDFIAKVTKFPELPFLLTIFLSNNFNQGGTPEAERLLAAHPPAASGFSSCRCQWDKIGGFVPRFRRFRRTISPISSGCP